MKKSSWRMFLLFAVAVVTVFLAPQAFAAKQAVFPNGQNLQPLPPTVQANVSGNVQRNGNDYPQPVYASPDQTTPASPVSDAATPQSGGGFNYIEILIGIIVVLLFAAGAIWFISAGAE